MRSVVLSGFMATGKSTVGRLVAERLGLPFVDTDALLAAETGLHVSELFVRDGEARFRDREERLILPLLSDEMPRVLAFGGGSMTIPRVRHAALEAATVVTLAATPEAIVARAAKTGGARPNLETAASPIARAEHLIAVRRDAYAEAHGTVRTDKLSPEDAAAKIIEIAARDAVVVPLGARSYAVEFADGAPEILARSLRELAPSSVVVVTDENVLAARGAWLEEGLGGHRVTRVVLPPGEENKTLPTIARIWDAALGAEIDRDAVVLAFGGGVVGDLAGFAASTILRGIRCVQIPTTLLSMVDSSVGGKTGFDHAKGKNLLGAFFQPSRVICDLSHLTTLDPRQRAAGLAEAVKIALVRDAQLLSLLEEYREGGPLLRAIVRASVVAKMRVVREDEHETGVRALLNLGHTLGHALESYGGYSRWLHGEAVAIGSVLEIAAAERLGLTPTGTAEHAAKLFARCRLPTSVPHDDLAAAWPFVFSDKKRAGSKLKFPVVSALGEGRVERIELDALRVAAGI